jgi:murein DD-endopeptidase MepM/ murein hydrolase activator NlpD
MYKTFSDKINKLEVTINSKEEKIAEKDQKIKKLETYINEQREAYGGGELALYEYPIHPDDYIVPTSPFGRRLSPFTGEVVEHTGVDLLGVWKARIVSISDGVVIEHYPVPGTPIYKNGKVAGYYKGHPIYGGMIKVKHDDGSIALYGHMCNTFVHEGQRLEAGQVIGRQGDTGLSKGAHLHFELYVNNELVNPLKYLKEDFFNVE